MPKNPYYSGPITDHFDGIRFHNLREEPETDRSFRDVMRWKRNVPDNPWPRSLHMQAVVPDARVDGLRVTMIGHATVLIQIAGHNLVTDPVWSDRTSLLSFAGPRRISAPGVALRDLPAIDAVMLSHNHYDHLDVATLKRIHARDAPLIVTPLGNDRIIQRHISGSQTRTGDWGDAIEISNDLKVHIVPALHWSSRSPWDRRMALWCGFVIEAAGTLIYFAGDTGYGTGGIFRRIRERFGPMDLAIIPIGAYAPRWFMAAQHTDPEEAIQIMLDVEARAAIGIHWGTFKLTDEPWDEPKVRLEAGLLARGIPQSRFPAFMAGDVRDF
ncbi:MBL fold metallo-hydrolase [Altericroceibacterium endophyticum]|uniref:Metallo-beta-lactamase domain-containing protein n=1 Tax=Altericroceibacterium endophyticum TaxID=1808508 RepID=A0A6I4T871_9SPHN|nr:MBL fold metallo-hydrolase [Altericroceibacterium endophyticum]MXO66213.1 hypothetical protein [Altericroceibacterium endophyticum]